ncbi:MAG: hypothetical protein IJP46_10095 [Prevotella sp.]|nr:hypothetical protein [Prevotella sp.]
MKERLLILISILASVSLTAAAQTPSFDLYFANNVTDVENLNEETIEQSDNGLVWTKVNRETVNVYGNYVEVNQIKEMFASTQMKNLTQQKQFWRMRDHSLVCFRINDGKGTYGSFGVEVDDGYGTKINLTVSKFFYSNIPLQRKPISFKVWKMNAENDTIRFKYESDDWNDNNLYVFQLDSKRQMSGETYVLEYDLSYADDNGDLQEEKHYLDISSRNFQSFYIPANRTLADIFLMSGDPATTPVEDLKKLRIDKNRLHPGVTPYNKYYNLTLSPRFELDKHENRELVNFNWIGTGLYEKFDTLYIKLKKANGDDVRSAQMNVAQVDNDGNEVPNGAPVKYCGWDEGRKVHKVLTNGNPAYIEILPPKNNNSFFPMMLEYRGSTDPLTNIVDEERCNAEAVVVPGNIRTADFSISNQHFHGLHDEKNIIMYRGEEHALCTLDDLDLAGRAVTDLVEFANDGCQEGKKLMNGRPIEQLGELVLTFSELKETTDITPPQLVVYDVDSGGELQTLTANADAQMYNISKFTRKYYDVTYDLTSLQENTECRLVLKTNDKSYDKLPYFRRFVFVRDESESETNDYMNDLVNNSTADDPTKKVGDKNADFNAEWAVPLNFKWDSPVKGLSISSSFYFNLSKKLINFKISADYRRESNHDGPDGQGDGSNVSKMRKDIDEYRNWDKFRDYTPANSADLRDYEVMQGGSDKEGHITGGAVSDAGQQKLNNWVFSEFDDIFSLPVPGFSVSGGLKCAGVITKLGKWSDAEKKMNMPVPVISDLSLYFKLAYGAFVPNALERLGRKILGKPGETLFKYGSFISMNAVAEAAFEVSASYKNYAAEEMGWIGGAHGLLISATAKVRGGISAEIHTPPNPVLHVGAGVRAGAKLGLGGAFGTDFHGHNDVGGMFTGLLGVEAYAYVRSIVGTLNVAAEAHLGNRVLIGPQDDHNPFHDDYPYWSPAKKKALPKKLNRTEETLPDVVYGNELVTGLNYTANPHYLDANSVVYNDPATPDDYNDDRVVLLNTADNTTTTLSADGARATNHMRSKRGEHEVVVFEEMTRSIEATEVDTENSVDKATELSTQQRIVANVRTQGGQWKRTVICDDASMTDSKPIVTIQENGHAACVWLRGAIKNNEETADNDDDFFNTYMDGQMVLSVFDGNSWSSPVNLFRVDKDNVAKQYDLIMRNDTVLVGANFTKNFYDETRRSTQFTYASVPFSTKTPAYVQETLHPMRFFMNRVGEHAVIALLYEKNDTLSDIYVKTLAMNGRDDGRAGNDLGARFCSPKQVKIICDREASSLSDFAVLWTEMSNTVHGEDATAAGNGEARMILNASRVALAPSVCVTSPLTMGAEKDNLLITDFDGFLDDQHIKVVYTLTNVADETAIIMENDRYFTNSFLFDVNYTKEALLGSSTLPVSVTIINTGTSAIKDVTATINGSEFLIADSRVQPLSVKEFIVSYPIDANFNGYLETSVKVDYDNVFRATRHALKRNVSLTSQTREPVRSYAAMEDVELRLIGQDIEDGVNSFGVELIDHSVNGLREDNEIHVGLFASSLPSSLLASGAETVVRASDFMDYGGVRKAYAKVQVSGVAETTYALLNLYIAGKVDDDSDGEYTLIENAHANDNAHFVYLQPSNDPTDINPVKFQETKARLAVKVTAEANGVRISGLPTGLDAEGRPYHVRIYDTAGKAMYSRPVTADTVFVPLSAHGVYVLSTGKDILKFQF